MIPNTDPECFGAMSVGLTTTAVLCMAAPNMQMDIRSKAQVKDLVWPTSTTLGSLNWQN